MGRLRYLIRTANPVDVAFAVAALATLAAGGTAIVLTSTGGATTGREALIIVVVSVISMLVVGITAWRVTR